MNNNFCTCFECSNPCGKNCKSKGRRGYSRCGCKNCKNYVEVNNMVYCKHIIKVFYSNIIDFSIVKK